MYVKIYVIRKGGTKKKKFDLVRRARPECGYLEWAINRSYLVLLYESINILNLNHLVNYLKKNHD